jgi:hypothetical protein
MGFDRGFGDAELVGDLLVEQAAGQHHQHAHLLRRQRREPGEDIGACCIGPGADVDVRRHPDTAFQHPHDRGSDCFDP